MKPHYLGYLLLAVGAGLLLWGYNLSGELEARLTRVVTGSYSHKVMWFLAGGAVSVVLGSLLAFRRR